MRSHRRHDPIAVPLGHVELDRPTITRRAEERTEAEQRAVLAKFVELIAETYMYRAGEVIDERLSTERSRQAVQVLVAEGLL